MKAVAKENPSLAPGAQGSLMAEQPRAPSAPSLPPIPIIGAAALAQGGRPHHSGNHFNLESDANSDVFMSGLATSTPASSQMRHAKIDGGGALIDAKLDEGGTLIDAKIDEGGTRGGALHPGRALQGFICCIPAGVRTLNKQLKYTGLANLLVLAP